MELNFNETENNVNSMSEYATLILQRDRLKKEAEEIFRRYVIKFGELMETELGLRIEIIKLKKTIYYCQHQRNFNRPIVKSELDEYIEAELNPYIDELNCVKEIKDDKGITLSEYEMLVIKKTYKKIATLIHPDLHPNIFHIEGIFELWEKAKIAYHCNDLDNLQEAEIAITEILKNNAIDVLSIEIMDIETKKHKIINEIEQIKTTDPYMYKEILDDNDAINEKTNEFEEQIESYKTYISELQNIVQEFDITELVN